MTPARDTIDAAIAWHVRLRNGSEEDWLAFTAWLEADPDRSRVYDEVAAADQLLPAALESRALAVPAEADNDDEPQTSAQRRARWPLPMAGIAAALVMAFGIATWRSTEPDLYAVSAMPGQQRQVTIADGSIALLSGGTRLILDRNNPRFAQLDSGEALFTIRHDPARPFSIAAGEHTVEDAGTSFNLLVDTDRFSLEILGGAVVLDRERSPVRLTAGQTLVVNKGSSAIVGRKDPSAMAGWRHGELSYSGATVESVARDLSRNLGVQILATPDVAKVPFTGSVHLDSSAAETIQAFSSTLGIEARHEDQKWVIGLSTRAPR